MDAYLRGGAITVHRTVKSLCETLHNPHQVKREILLAERHLKTYVMDQIVHHIMEVVLKYNIKIAIFNTRKLRDDCYYYSDTIVQSNASDNIYADYATLILLHDHDIYIDHATLMLLH